MVAAWEGEDRTRRALDKMGINTNYRQGILKALDWFDKEPHKCREFIGHIEGFDHTTDTTERALLGYRVQSLVHIYQAAGLELPAHYKRFVNLMNRRPDIQTLDQLESAEWQERKLTMNDTPNTATEGGEAETTKAPKAPREKVTEPRDGSKTKQVLDLALRSEGTTLAQAAEALGGDATAAKVKIILTQDLKKYGYAVTKEGEGDATVYKTTPKAAA